MHSKQDIKTLKNRKIKIKNGPDKIIGNVYRPNTAPFADIKKFNQTLSEVLFILKNNIDRERNIYYIL